MLNLRTTFHLVKASKIAPLRLHWRLNTLLDNYCAAVLKAPDSFIRQATNPDPTRTDIMLTIPAYEVTKKLWVGMAIDSASYFLKRDPAFRKTISAHLTPPDSKEPTEDLFLDLDTLHTLDYYPFWRLLSSWRKLNAWCNQTGADSAAYSIPFYNNTQNPEESATCFGIAIQSRSGRPLQTLVHMRQQGIPIPT